MSNTNIETKNQVYLTNKDLTNIYQQYKKTQIKDQKQDVLEVLKIARACFFFRQYQQCISLLKKITKQQYTPKVLYQRQTLLFKASYLRDSENMDTLDEVIGEYEVHSKNYDHQDLKQFHHATMRQMLEVVKKGNEKYDKIKQIPEQQLKKKLSKHKRTVKFEGLPMYLISKDWNQRLQQFFNKNGKYPGPATNFQLLNHLHQFQPHQEQSKVYMNTLLFPYLINTGFVTVSAKCWRSIEEIFGGYPIKRIFTIRDFQFNDEDNLIKTCIQHQGKKIIMQWQGGTYWDKSVIPTLINKFGLGQLKLQTQNKDFVVIPPSKVSQPTALLKYVAVDITQINASNKKFASVKKKFLSIYDMQQFEINKWETQHTVGLINLRNTCYMNSALQVLSNIRVIPWFFLSNKYLSKLNLNEQNKNGSVGEVACAFGDIIKRLWFSGKQTQYIDPLSFKQVFEKRFPMFYGNLQQDAQQFLIFLLNCLHEDLNEKVNVSKIKNQSVISSQFEGIVTSSIKNYNRHNSSIISDLFNGFLYEQIVCKHCGDRTFRVQNNFMIHVPVPPNQPKINVLMFRAHSQIQPTLIYINIKGLQKMSEVVDIAVKYFKTQPECQLHSYWYVSNEWVQADLNRDAIQVQSTNPFMYIYQVKKPQTDDEEVIKISFLYKRKFSLISECDGYPRFLCINKISEDDLEKGQKIAEMIKLTLPQNLRQKWSIEQSNEITTKQVSDKFYTKQYEVIVQQKLQHYQRKSLEKTFNKDGLQDEIKLEEIFEKMNCEEVIKEEEGWLCERCNQVRAVSKTDKIYSLGKYLIIHLKRFTDVGGKITTKIIYPITLNMQPYIHNDIKIKQDSRIEHQYSNIFIMKNQHNQMKINSSFVQKKQENYSLCGVIMHFGSLNSGHYSCICRSRKNRKWVYYNDHFVSEPSDENFVIQENAYMLIYEKVDEHNSFL